MIIGLHTFQVFNVFCRGTPTAADSSFGADRHVPYAGSLV